MNLMNCGSSKQAINSELDSLKKHGGYDMVDKLKDFPSITGKWIFVTKRLPDGSNSKHLSGTTSRLHSGGV